ncbi:hypothetical protein V2J94_46585 [Streptomyces sp. DSM 41524]|uniref:Uncharacterized protein n=1 Tax=Streptomyces asiaticus subsp. ignotus TaxID=3098222 RepID=A0ABU7QCS5_9ACTN|nr:hypothetical protein [Streptomyces sp. DSM 41524]
MLDGVAWRTQPGGRFQAVPAVLQFHRLVGAAECGVVVGVPRPSAVSTAASALASSSWLPTPAGPVSVSSRTPSSSRAGSTGSSVRPTRLLSWVSGPPPSAVSMPPAFCLDPLCLDR